MTRPDRWTRAAERENARRERKVGPLFAASVQRTTPEAQQAKVESLVEQQRRAIEAGSRRSAEHAAEARATIASVVTPEELARLDAELVATPRDPAYAADHWCGECRRRGLPWPGKTRYDALWAEVARLTAQRDARRGPEPDQLELTECDAVFTAPGSLEEQ